MADTEAVDTPRDRLTESLSSAKDVTLVAVRDDILPAVTAVALAAKDAAVPAYNEAHQRAGTAVNALKGSDAAQALLAATAASAVQVKNRRRRPSKKVMVISLIGIGGATYVMKRKRNAPAADIYATATMPSVIPVPEAEEITLDETAEAPE